MRKLLMVFAAGATLAMAGCSGNGAAGESKPQAGAEAAGKPVVAVDVQKVAPVKVSSGIEVVGTLAPKFETLVRAEIKSRVTDVYVTQWLPVSAGTVLAKSDTRDIETALSSAKAALLAAKSQEEAAGAQMEIIRAQKESLRAQVESAKAAVVEAEVGRDRADREYQRMVKLSESGLATRQGLDEALSARDAGRARVETAKAQIKALEGQIAATDAQLGAAKSSRDAAVANAAAAAQQVSGFETTLSKAVVKSPMNGIVAERFVNVGDLPGDTPLFHIVDNRVLNLTVAVPMRDQGGVKVGQTLEFTTEALPGETFSGRVMFINPIVNQADRSVGVLAEVGNPDGRLKGGMFVKGRLLTVEGQDVLALPRAALAAWDVKAKTAEVYVVASDKAARRRVTTGGVYGDNVEVVAGVAAGESVIVRGGFNVKDGDRVIVAPGQGAK